MSTTTDPTPRFAIGDHVYAVAMPNGIPSPCPERRGLVITSHRLINPSSPDSPSPLAPYWRYEAERRTNCTFDHNTHSVEGAERFFRMEN